MDSFKRELGEAGEAVELKDHLGAEPKEIEKLVAKPWLYDVHYDGKSIVDLIGEAMKASVKALDFKGRTGTTKKSTSAGIPRRMSSTKASTAGMGTIRKSRCALR